MEAGLGVLKERDLRIDYARAVAVLMMILQHVCIYLHAQDIKVTYKNAILIEVILMITKSAVPLFVIITGSVLLSDEKDFSMEKAFSLSFRMIKIIAVWNVISALYFYANDGLKIALGKLVYGNYWYLYMLVALYLLMPVVNLILRYGGFKISLYLVIASLIYQGWLSYSLTLPDAIQKYAIRFVDKFQLSLITGYTGLLLIGALIRGNSFSNIKYNKKSETCLSICTCALMLGLLLYSIFEAKISNHYNYIYFDEFTATIIASVIFMLFLRKSSLRTWNLGRFIGTHSMGIYIVSNMVLDVYRRIPLCIEAFSNNFLGIAICWIMIIIPTCLIVWILSKTPLKKFV